MQAEPVEVLEERQAVPSFSPDEIGAMLEWTRNELMVGILVELREMRMQLDTFAQLGDAFAQLGAGGGGMLGRLLGFGGG